MFCHTLPNTLAQDPAQHVACCHESQVVFGRTYEMRIEEGAAGPLFKVRAARMVCRICCICSGAAAGGAAGSNRRAACKDHCAAPDGKLFPRHTPAGG